MVGDIDGAAVCADADARCKSDEISFSVRGVEIFCRPLEALWQIPHASRRAVEGCQTHLAVRADEDRADLRAVLGLARGVPGEAHIVGGPASHFRPPLLLLYGDRSPRFSRGFLHDSLQPLSLSSQALR